MLRRTHPIPEDAITMLREKELKKYVDVYTSDGEHLGVTMRFHHRPPEEVDPELRLYRTYLEVQSVEMGGPIYIPTLFIDAYDPATNRLTVATTLTEVEEALWNRKPDFIARGWNVREELP